MPSPNPVREAFASGRFCYVVELVASRLTREAKLLQVASQLAQVPGVVAGSITSYAGGAMGHDPIRVGTAARARGLVPNIHLTCVNRDRLELRRALEGLPATWTTGACARRFWEMSTFCRPRRRRNSRGESRRDAGSPQNCSKRFNPKRKPRTRVWRPAWNGPHAWWRFCAASATPEPIWGAT